MAKTRQTTNTHQTNKSVSLQGRPKAILQTTKGGEKRKTQSFLQVTNGKSKSITPSKIDDDIEMAYTSDIDDQQYNETDSLDEIRLYHYYINMKMTIDATTEMLTILRRKYIYVLTTLQEADDRIQVLPVDPTRNADKIETPSSIPHKMTQMSKYFLTTSKAPTVGEGDMWVTIRISADTDLEDILQDTEYDMREERILLMKKRVQCFKTTTPGYFQFINNRIDPVDLQLQIQDDIGTSGNWTIYLKNPWEGFKDKSTKKKIITKFSREGFLTKAPHIECDASDEDSVVKNIRHWIKSGKASLRFGPHIKYIEALNVTSHPQQIDRTIRMNAYGKRFQNSIDMVELSGLNNPNGKINEFGSIREKILQQRTTEGNPIIISVTKKWGSPLWQGTYIKKSRTEAVDFASCPAAWLTEGQDKKYKDLVFKSFDPDAVEEALESTWDEETKRIITPKERIANEDIEAVANIPWLLDLQNMEDPDSESTVTFKSGVNFNFDEEMSVKTTRVTQDTEMSSSPPAVSNQCKSILKSPGDASSINSEITTDTRIKSLESSLGEIFNYIRNSKAPTVALATSQTTDNDELPASPKGGVGK